ncbi:hypothetical protein HID58_042173 [Brassica napus]|uniref:Uncharacterized protein n=1 Tax=Brassica napus TaxID=3708 RepID=A0ABQ8BCZ3_BRANA|nr:hypothetical protein HID58_042173 [Brassica napus]
MHPAWRFESWPLHKHRHGPSVEVLGGREMSRKAASGWWHAPLDEKAHICKFEINNTTVVSLRIRTPLDQQCYLSIKSESNDLCYPSKLTMANSCILLGDLKAGRCTNTVVVHLLRFWEAEKCEERRRVGGSLMKSLQLLVSASKAGRCTETVVVRLVWFREARNVNKNGDLMGVDMVLVDERPTLIQGCISRHQLNIFQQLSKFLCTAKVDNDCMNMWCYISCSKCSRKLHRGFSSLTCISCKNENVIGVLKLSTLNRTSLIPFNQPHFITHIM